MYLFRVRSRWVPFRNTYYFRLAAVADNNITLLLVLLLLGITLRVPFASRAHAHAPDDLTGGGGGRVVVVVSSGFTSTGPPTAVPFPRRSNQTPAAAARFTGGSVYTRQRRRWDAAADRERTTRVHRRPTSPPIMFSRGRRAPTAFSPPISS